MKTTSLFRSSRLLRRLADLTSLCAIIALGISYSARAADGSWNTTSGNSTWLTSGSWVGNTIAGAASPSTTDTDTATFNTAVTAAFNITVDANRNIKNIKVGSTGSTAAVRYQFVTGALALTSGGSILENGTTSAHYDLFNNAITLEGSYAFDSGSYNSAGLQFAGNVSGAASLGAITLTLQGSSTAYKTVATAYNVIGGIIADGSGNTLSLVKAGTGYWGLTNANTYSGGTTINNGNLYLGTSGTLGNTSGSLTMAGGMLDLGALTTPQVGAVSITAAPATAAQSTITNGTLTASSYSVTLTSGTAAIYAILAGSGTALTLNGAGGTLALNNANTYTGDTTISAGTLTLGASGSISSANISVNGTYNVASVSGGYHLATGKTMSGTGTVTGPVTVDSGATLTVAGSSGTTMATLTANGGLTLNGTTTLRLNKGGGTTSDKITWSSGSVALGGTLNLSSVGTTLANGDTFTILNNGATGAFTNITPSTPGTGLSWDTSLLNSQGKIGVTLPTTGTISAPATFPAAFTAISGTASAAQSVSVTVSSGSLSSGITATAPTGLEVSSDGSSYNTTATLLNTGGTLYARLKSSATVGACNSASVVLSNPNASSVNVATTASGNQVAAGPFWAVASSGNWGTAGDWFAGTIASGSGVTADFSQVDITSDTTVHLDSSYSVGNLIFGNTDVSPAKNWILDNNGSSGNTLTLAGGTPTVTVNNLGSGESATISAEIDGTNFIKAGTGTVTLSPGTATDTMGSLKAAAGGLTLTGGTLNVTNIGTAAGNGFWINGGTVTVAGGTLNANAGLVTIQGGGTLAVSSGTFNAGSGTSLLDGYNTSSGTVTVSGTGLLIANFLRVSQSTGLGTVNLNGGTLQLNSFTDTGSGGTVNFNGTTVQARSATTAFTAVTNNITYKVQAGGTIITNAVNITIGSPLVHDSTLGASLDGGLTKLGAGTLTLTNANTYTGGTTNTAGTLALSGGGTLGATTGALTLSGGTLDLGALTTPQVGAVSLTGASIITNGTLTASSYSATLTSGTAAIYAILAGSGTALTMNGAGGTLALNNANTYTGNTTINAGALVGVVGGGCANSTVILNASTATNGVSITDNTKSWTCANLTAAAAGVLQFNFSASPSTTVAPLVVTGAADFSAATPKISVVGSIPAVAGAYPLMTWGSKSGTVPSAFIAIPSVAMATSLSNSATTLYLVLAPIPVTSFPVVAAAPTNLFTNGNFGQVANQVVLSNSITFNINGSFGDYPTFWGSTADLVGWSPYCSDPYGLTTNVTPFANDPSKVLNTTYYLDTLIDTSKNAITLNSADYYLNGLKATNILNGVTIKAGATYLFTVSAGASTGLNETNSTFMAALTQGTGVNVTNLATAVTGSLLQMPSQNLPMSSGATTHTTYTNTISGADLATAQSSGPVNMIFNQINTNGIAGYPTNCLPQIASQVAQVKVYGVGLKVVVSSANDLNHDGVVDQADVNLAQSYLDGSVDGGASATNRENLLITTYGFTTNQALAYLNLTAFDINGDGFFNAADVAALQAMVGTVAPTLNYSVVAPNQIQFNWSGAFKLQWLTNTLSAGLQTNVSNGWVYYPNTNNPVTVTNNQTIPSAFFRLSQ